MLYAEFLIRTVSIIPVLLPDFCLLLYLSYILHPEAEQRERFFL
jgi:hypothetical protein